ncbi:MAG: secretion protein [Bacteroidales bacterium]|nr:secretion protein [Bacteroidales bacterium]
MRNLATLALASLSIFSMGAAAPVASPGKYHEPIGIERQWRHYHPGKINFQITSPEKDGAKIYSSIVSDPDSYITDNARRVIQTLYFSPADSIPDIRVIDYVVRDFDGISYKSGGGDNVRIDYSTDWIEKSFANNDTLKLDYETRGVIYHELTHAFQLEPKGCGSYDGKSPYWAFIEGTADAVRLACGCFEQDFASKDRPRGGNWMSGYRITGYFLYWLNQNKDKDFIRKFNRTALDVVPWSWDEAMYHILGRDEKNSVASLWNEYMAAVGDEEDAARAQPVVAEDQQPAERKHRKGKHHRK